MKNYLWLLRIVMPLTCLFELAGCTRYQYATVSSPLKKTERQEFVHENDSIRVVYNFNGEGGPIKIAVHNKLDTPIFVNWRMSSLIVNSQSMPYYDNVSNIAGSGAGEEIDWGNGFASASMNFMGIVTLDEDISFIPPGRFIMTSPASLKHDFFKFDPTVKLVRKSLTSLSGPVTGRGYNFQSDNSPLHYQSYLTYSTDTNFASIATVEDSFWIGEVVNTFVNPNNLMNMERKGDTFHNSKITGFGTFMTAVALVILVAINAAIEQ